MTEFTKLTYLLCDYGAVVTMTTAKGCRCMSCHVYQIDLGDDGTFQDDGLADCIEKAWVAVKADPPTSELPH